MPPLRCAHAPTTARAFVQLSMGVRAPPPPASIMFDLLLPRSFHVSSRTGAVRTGLPQYGKQQQQFAWQGDPAAVAVAFARPPAYGRRAAFSTTAARRATHAVYNPQRDAEGNEMKVEITPRAAKRLSEIMAKDANPNLALRIQVESGGCHGFQYLMSLVTLPPALPAGKGPDAAAGAAGADPVVREDDTILTYAPDGSNAEGDLAAPKVIMDAPSLELLQGSKVDFTMELIGSQFKIVDNPHATSSCGCGTSFDIKI